MSAIFTPATNTLVKVSLVGLVLLTSLSIGWWWVWPRMDLRLHTDWTVEQPVPFSHQHHVDGIGLDCRFCHTTVETSGNAGIPPTYTCMTCHSEIWTNAAILAPVRDSLASNTPLVWHRINDLPDFVYFNHAIHIAKGVGCSECHGQIDKMPLLHKVHGFTMGFCIGCHANPGPWLRPKDQIFNLEWHRDASTPSPQALLRLYHIGDRRLTDCSICHR